MKFSNLAKTYAIATQGFFSLVIMTGLGYLIGYLIDKKSILPVILAVVGLLIGLFIFVSYLLYIIKQDEKEKKKNDKGTKD